MNIRLIIDNSEEQPFLELAKKAADFIIRNNEHVFEKNLKKGFSNYDNCYVSFTKNEEFTFLQCPQNTKYIFLFFRIMTKKGKLWNAQSINVIDIENSQIFELNHDIRINLGN
jgi:hypothetical protein